MQMSYSSASDFQKLLQTRQTSRNYQKQVLVMIKHCLGNSQINSIPAWSRYYSFTARNQRNFRPWKPTLPLTRRIKVHRRALVPYSLPSQWKLRKRVQQFSIFDPVMWQHPRENPRQLRGSSRVYDVRMAQFALKIEKWSHIMAARRSQGLRSPSLIMVPDSYKCLEMN